MELYRVRYVESETIMLAPIPTIQKFLQLHQDAITRLVRETAEGGECWLYDTKPCGTVIVTYCCEAWQALGIEFSE